VSGGRRMCGFLHFERRRSRLAEPLRAASRQAREADHWPLPGTDTVATRCPTSSCPIGCGCTTRLRSPQSWDTMAISGVPESGLEPALECSATLPAGSRPPVAQAQQQHAPPRISGSATGWFMTQRTLDHDEYPPGATRSVAPALSAGRVSCCADPTEGTRWFPSRG
jgi:hypothetical protein